MSRREYLTRSSWKLRKQYLQDRLVAKEIEQQLEDLPFFKNPESRVWNFDSSWWEQYHEMFDLIGLDAVSEIAISCECPTCGNPYYHIEDFDPSVYLIDKSI